MKEVGYIFIFLKYFQVCAPLKEIPISGEATCNQFDDKVLEALQSHDFTDSGACVGSPFADDFGNDPNGWNFQDGTSEQDVSLSELLEGLRDHENSCEESTGHIKSESPMPGRINDPEQRSNTLYNVNIRKNQQEADTEMVQAQVKSMLSIILHIFYL